MRRRADFACTTAERAWVGATETLRVLQRRKEPSSEETHARALLVQLCKAFEQHARDKGSWRHAWRMTGLVDQFEGPEFAGTAEERSMVLAYEKQANALRLRGAPSSTAGAPEGPSKRALRRKTSRASGTRGAAAFRCLSARAAAILAAWRRCERRLLVRVRVSSGTSVAAMAMGEGCGVRRLAA